MTLNPFRINYRFVTYSGKISTVQPYLAFASAPARMLVFSKVLILRFWSSAFIEDEEVVLILKDTMEEAGRALLKVVPAEAEVVIVDSWAEKWHLLDKGIGHVYVTKKSYSMV